MSEPFVSSSRPEASRMAHYVLGLVVGWISGALFVLTIQFLDGWLA